MLPIGLLMREHRLIGRMVLLVKKELQRSKKSLKIDTEFIRISIDFFKTYADMTHHGKEEEILFKALEEKNLSEDHIKTLNRLLNDHKIARETVHAI
jgi:hemerythrin-like domain-containing protein